jgi:heptosyltransferase-2
MAQPMLARLLQKRGDLVIDMLGPKWVLPVAERMPEITGTIESPFLHGELNLRGRWRLGRSLAARGYAQAIVLPNTFKSALVPFFADIDLRVGYVGESRYGLINIVHRLDKKHPPPMVERYLALAEAPGAPLPEIPRTRLKASGENLARALARLSLQPPSDARPVAVLCPGAEYGPAKRWPPEYFATLAVKLGQAGFGVWLMGSEKDQPVAQAILEARPGCAVDLCGKTDLASAIDLLAIAHVVVSNDSGLMHIAAALDRPLVALFGSSSPIHTPPRTAKARIQYLAVECSPCYQRVCPLGHFKCMRDMSPEQIFGEALAAAGGISGSASVK